MRRYSFEANRAHRDEFSAEQFAILIFIDHADMEKPIRLSTHPSDELTFDPPAWCTRSTWMTENPAADPFLWIPMETLLPSDKEDAPASGNFIIANLTPEIAKLLRSIRDQATLHYAMVRPSEPDVIEYEMTDLLVISHDITPGEVRVDFSREPTEFEADPEGLMTKQRYPGLHR